MGLLDLIFSSSSKKKLTPFNEMLKANMLNSVEGKNEFCIGNDIKSIVNYKTQNQKIARKNRRDEEYLLVKQIVYIKNNWGIESNLICPNCHKQITKNHVFFCDNCKYNFIEEYDFDYDELIKTNVLGFNKYMPSYSEDKLEEYIKNKRRELINKNLSKFADELSINKYAYLLNSIAYYVVKNGEDFETREEYLYNNKSMSYDKVIKIIEKNGTDYKTSKHVMIFAECCIVDNINNFFLPDSVFSKDGKKEYLKKDYINAVKDVVEYRSKTNKNPSIISIYYLEDTLSATKSNKKSKKSSSTKDIPVDKSNKNKSHSDNVNSDKIQTTNKSPTVLNEEESLNENKIVKEIFDGISLYQDFEKFKDITGSIIELEFMLRRWGRSMSYVKSAIEKLKFACLKYELYEVSKIDNLSNLNEYLLLDFCEELESKTKEEFINLYYSSDITKKNEFNVFYEGYEIVEKIIILADIENKFGGLSEMQQYINKFKYYCLKYKIHYDMPKDIKKFSAEDIFESFNKIKKDMCNKILENKFKPYFR